MTKAKAEISRRQASARGAQVTSNDVARRAGVSQSAVSRAFTPGASISAKARLAIVTAARELGYRPNLVARSLNTGRTNMVGVIVPPLENHFYPQALEALSTAFDRIGYRMVLFTAPRGSSVEPILDEMLNLRVDAVVMVAASVSSTFADECAKIGLPIVLLNRRTDSAVVSSVIGDNEGGAVAIADFLVAGDHRRIAYIAGLEQSSTNREREDSFCRHLAKLGHRLAARAVGHYSTAGARTAARELLGMTTVPDAIFCANDHMALVAIDIARSEFGLDVGRDISIVGFDDSSVASWGLFDLTTFSQPIETMADRVAAIIKQQLDGDGSVVQDIIPGKLVIRGSARQPAPTPRGDVTRPLSAA
jgi:DNA-binding LacI/PurR family transcriptional regulator